MAHYVKVTQGVFDAVKLLLKSGAKYDDIKKYFNIGKDIIGYINHSETYEEYKHALYEKNHKNRVTKEQVAAIKAKEAAKAEEPPVQKTQVVIPYHVIEKLDKTNEYLKAISNKLAFIVDELCGVKTNAEQDH